MDILEIIQKIGQEIGFDLMGVAEVKSEEGKEKSEKLDEWVKNGYHADMKWFADTVKKRKDILKVMPDAKSVICVAMNYYSDTENKKEKNTKNAITFSLAIASENVISNLGENLNTETVGKIARYARGRDYHKIFNKKLKLFVKRLEEEILLRQLADQDDKQNDKDWIPAPAGMTDIKFKYYCDTGPVLERMWATRAGLGFVGKNTNLITKYGSWVLLGEIITNIAISDQQLAISHSKANAHLNTCGSCRKCLDACPTGALCAPYTVDARKCISYLTIEHKGEIPMELWEKMGNRIFGCDACQEVCPFNIGRQRKIENELTQKVITGQEINLKEILSIKTDEEFLKKFAGSPLMRAKRRRLIRNACIAAGNSGDKSLLSYLEECLNDAEPIIVSHAKWAIEKLKKGI